MRTPCSRACGQATPSGTGLDREDTDVLLLPLPGSFDGIQIPSLRIQTPRAILRKFVRVWAAVRESTAQRGVEERIGDFDQKVEVGPMPLVYFFFFPYQPYFLQATWNTCLDVYPQLAPLPRYPYPFSLLTSYPLLLAPNVISTATTRRYG